jgi:hypothetical protein
MMSAQPIVAPRSGLGRGGKVGCTLADGPRRGPGRLPLLRDRLNRRLVAYLVSAASGSLTMAGSRTVNVEPWP